MICLNLFATGCSFFLPQTPPAAPTNITASHFPPASTNPVAEEISECDTSLFAAKQWAANLSFEEVVAIPQSYQGESSLILWLVDPNLSASDPEMIAGDARNQAIRAAAELVQESNCVLQFENIHASVVDSEYRLWFSGSFRTIDLRSMQVGETGAGNEAQQGGGRVLPPIEEQNAASGATCTWRDASQALEQHFAGTNQPAVFYFSRDSGGANLFAHFSVSSPEEIAATDPWIKEIHNQVTCLHSTLDGVSITFTLPDNQILLTGHQPLNHGGSYDPGLFTSTQFEVQ